MALPKSWPKSWWAGVVLLAALCAQRPFRVYPSLEPYDDVSLPVDWQQNAEWIFGRLMYPVHPNARFGRYSRRFGGIADWRQGGTSWTQDYPRADRHFAQAIRRLTRISARSVEQPVNLDDEDDVFNWPWLCAGEMGDWKLTDAQSAKLREYLLRGGFLMLDDFWGSEEWDRFNESMRRVFPDRRIVEIDSGDAIFHTIYDLDDRFQVAGWQWRYTRRTYEAGETGKTPHWRAIFDDKGRVMVAICHNMDLGDAWEWSDDPRYPEKWASLAYRIAMNYFIYDLTH